MVIKLYDHMLRVFLERGYKLPVIEKYDSTNVSVCVLVRVNKSLFYFHSPLSEYLIVESPCGLVIFQESDKSLGHAHKNRSYIDMIRLLVS